MCDTWWYDIHHTWHTSVFFIISGAQMFMTYSERPVPTKTLMKNFFVSMAPLYYSVWKSKFYGAFVLNRRVVLHAIDATLDGVHPTRRLISTQVGTGRSE